MATPTFDYSVLQQGQPTGLAGLLSSPIAQGLLSAGLGALASRGTTSQAIGRGGLLGLSAFGNAAGEQENRLMQMALAKMRENALSQLTPNANGDVNATPTQLVTAGFTDPSKWSGVLNVGEPDKKLKQNVFNQLMSGGTMGSAPGGAQGGQTGGMVPGAARLPVAMDMVFNGGKGIPGLLKPNMVNVRPGGTVYDSTTGQIKFVAPTTTGTQVQYDAQGNPRVALLPGATSATATQSAAQASGPAQFRSSTVNMPNGSNVMMTDAQKTQWLSGHPTDPFTQAVMATESGGNPNAVSPKGAMGPMQTMPGTLAAPGFGVTPAQNGTPQEQTRVGADYLGAMMQKYGGNKALAAIAYNWGPGNTDMWLASGGDYSKLPTETKNYVSAVLTRDAVGGRQQPAPGQEVQGEGTIAANTELGKDQAKTLISSRDAAVNATDNLTNITQARRALEAGTYGGSGAQARLNAAKFVQGWLPGVASVVNIDPNKVTNTDYLVSTLGKGLLTNAKALGYNPTDTDAERIEAIIGTIGKDPQALQKILDYQELMAKRTIERHNMLVNQANKSGIQTSFDMNVSPQTGMPGSSEFSMAGKPSGFKIIGVR
jgi:hypothetical protein